MVPISLPSTAAFVSGKFSDSGRCSKLPSLLICRKQAAQKFWMVEEKTEPLYPAKLSKKAAREHLMLLCHLVRSKDAGTGYPVSDYENDSSLRQDIMAVFNILLCFPAIGISLHSKRSGTDYFCARHVTQSRDHCIRHQINRRQWLCVWNAKWVCRFQIRVLGGSDQEGVGHQVAGQGFDLLAHERLPALLRPPPDFLHALLCPWVCKTFVQPSQVLLEQRHAEAMDLDSSLYISDLPKIAARPDLNSIERVLD